MLGAVLRSSADAKGEVERVARKPNRCGRRVFPLWIVKVGRGVGFDGNDHELAMKIGRRCFSMIVNTGVLGYKSRVVEMSSDKFWVHPRPLIDSEVVPQIMPLNYGSDRVYYPSNNSDALQAVAFQKNPFELPPYLSSELPSWDGMVSGILGIFGICWGWRNTKRRPWSSLGFIVGCALWVYACFSLLPWWADRF